ncbi:MAG: carboxypeptidase regulatory-like domain-containing protein [Planctomycetales bacterium]|nr:carboxypeptidase regulatory-like domain-containing protein [Planctomycetales bacterium]
MSGLTHKGRVLAFTAVAALVLQPAVLCAQTPAGVAPMTNQAFQVVDVQLDATGGLSGQVMTPQGQPVPGATITLADVQPPQTTTTNAKGQFRLSGVRGGVHQLQVGSQMQMCRVWKAGTAPPSAVPQLLVVQDARVALAQNCGSPVACGLAGCKEALANPLVVGGLIAAAIAIPVAIHNADDDDPTS